MQDDGSLIESIGIRLVRCRVALKSQGMLRWGEPTNQIESDKLQISKMFSELVVQKECPR